MSLNEVSIKIPGEYIPNVFGQFDAFAKKIERTLHVTLVLRDDSLKIIGAQGLPVHPGHRSRPGDRAGLSADPQAKPCLQPPGGAG